VEGLTWKCDCYRIKQAIWWWFGPQILFLPSQNSYYSVVSKFEIIWDIRLCRCAKWSSFMSFICVLYYVYSCSWWFAIWVRFLSLWSSQEISIFRWTLYRFTFPITSLKLHLKKLSKTWRKYLVKLWLNSIHLDL